MFWTVVLEKILESPLDCKEFQPVNSKGNQSWIFIGKTDAEAESPILWPPDGKNWLFGKDSDAGKDWRQEDNGTTEVEMVGWHYRLDGHEFEQALGVGDRQEGLACCSPWGCKKSDTTVWLNWTVWTVFDYFLYSWCSGILGHSDWGKTVSPRAYQCLGRAGKTSDLPWSMPFILKLTIQSSYSQLFYLLHVFQEVIFLCPKYPRARYQTTIKNSSTSESTEIIQISQFQDCLLCLVLFFQ